MSWSMHANNKNKDILTLGKRQTTAEEECSINFLRSQKKICLSLYYNGINSILFVSGTEIYQFKAKDSKIKACPLCLGNISKDFSVDNMKETGLNGYVYDFSVDYNAIAVDDILEIHEYLMKEHDIK